MSAKTFSKIVGYVANLHKGCAFIKSAAAGTIFVNPKLAKGLEKGAQVTLDAAETWSESAGAFGISALHIYSATPPKKATAFATVKWFDPKKGYGFATLQQGEHAGSGVRISADIVKESGFEPKAGMPARLVFIIQNDGADNKFEAETFESGAEVAKAMKQALGSQPALTVVNNDQASQEVDAVQAA